MTNRHQINAEIREQLKHQRKQLNYKQQNGAAHKLASLAKTLSFLQQARHIASYMPFAGEIDPTPLTQQLTAEIALPRISGTESGEMQFYSSHNILVENQWGILEPTPTSPIINAKQFDLVLLPLVAFKPCGARLGMGGGFYDRYFGFRNTQPFKQPLLVGLAYDFQQNADFQTADWDVNLDVIITDQEIINPHN